MTQTTQTIAVDDFRNAVLAMLEETFENVRGYTLDPNTSLFETLATISAEQASRKYSNRCSNLAAQVNHTRFYLDVVLEGAREGFGKRQDWDSSWQIGEVSEAEWQALIERLRASYLEVRQLASTNEMWTEATIVGAIGMIAHSAHHLGEIRQALCLLDAPE